MNKYKNVQNYQWSPFLFPFNQLPCICGYFLKVHTAKTREIAQETRAHDCIHKALSAIPGTSWLPEHH